MRGNGLKVILAVIMCVTTVFSCFACATKPDEYSRTLTNSGLNVTLTVKGANSENTANAIFSAMEKRDASLFSSEGALSKFNSATGEIFQGEENIAGVPEKYLRVEADAYFYSAVEEAKRLYVDTEELFNVSAVRLRSLWHNGALPPPSDAIYRDVAGVQNPLLVDGKIVGGKYFVEKSVVTLSDGTPNEEHTYIGFEDMAEGIMCDAAAKALSGQNAVSADVRIGASRVYFGASATVEEQVVLSNGEKLCRIEVASGCFFTVCDVYKNSGYLGDGTFVGGIINPCDGCPTTLKKIGDDAYVQASDYPVAAAVISDGGSKSCAFAYAALIKGSESAAMLKRSGVSAIVFTSEGNVYVFGDVRFSLEGGGKGYNVVEL